MSSAELAGSALTGPTLTGRIVRRGDSDHPAASADWNLLFAHTPAVIVFAQQTIDAVNALAWARENHVEFRVRSGRHNLEGWSNVDGGLVIDVSELKSVRVDADAGTATVGAGLTQLEAVTALGAAGFAAPTGTEGTVGLVGATLGGGFGLLTRAFGMACDNLLAAEVVVASGERGAEVISVDEHCHPELLWALRGAGNGTFGVVTELTYRVHPLAQTVYITARWEGLRDLRAVFDAWQRSAPTNDARLTSQLEVHRDGMLLIGVLAGGSADEAMRMLEPLLSIGAPDVTTTNEGWAETYAAFQIATADEPANWIFRSEFVAQPFSHEALDLLESFMAKAPTAECNYFVNALGGAVVTSEPSGGSAFAHRDALFYAEPGAGWGSRSNTPTSRERSADARALTDLCEEWVKSFHAALQPHASGAYVNVPNPGQPDWEHAYWKSGVDRLRAVKAVYDPSDAFAYEQSIRAVAGDTDV